MSTDSLRLRRFSLPSRFARLANDGREARSLVVLAAPMTGAALVNMGMSITDTVMMGWIGPTALAAGAVVSDLYSIAFYFMAGILSIVALLVARARGAGDAGAVRSGTHSGLAAALAVSAPSFLMVWFAADFVDLFGVEGAVVALGSDYAHAMAFTIVPMLLVTVWRNLFGAIGRPNTYLIAIMAALPANAVADFVLMFGWGPVPALGIAGAGVASALVASTLLGGFMLYGLVNAELRDLGLFRSPWHIDRAELSEMFRLGLPVAFFTIGEVGIFLLATVVIALFGTEALAAHAITIRLAGVIYAIPAGLSQAATIRVSHAIGSRDHGALARAMRTALGVGVVSGTAIFAVLALGAHGLPRLLMGSESAAIVAVVPGLLVLLGLLNFAQGFAAPATAILRGFKDTRMPMVLCLTGYWLIGMPVAALAGFQFGWEAFGIWCGLALGVAATALLMNIRLLRWDIAQGWR